ncbi:MAG: hypothetical protein ABWY11_23080 [Umezawaea sp.]
MLDLDRADATTILVTRWTADDAPASVGKVLADWGPKADGLLSATGFAGTDGTSALLYEQWAGTPTSRREGSVEYSVYRALTRPDAPEVGCVVIVEAEFDGADVRTWVDAVLDALATDENPAEGGISAHFHTSADGRRALNYAEWTSEEAHAAALAKSGQGTVGLGEKWRRVKEFPGVVNGGFTRFAVVGGV